MLPVIIALLHTAGAEESAATATVEVKGADGLLLRQVTGQAIGTGVSSRGGTVTVQTTYYQDLCIAPCTVKMVPGVDTFFGNGSGSVLRSTRLQVPEGNSVLTIDPGSSALRSVGYVTGYLGLSAAIMGGALYAVSASDPAMTEEAKYALPAAIAGGAIGIGGFVVMTMNKGHATIAPGTPAAPAPTP